LDLENFRSILKSPETEHPLFFIGAQWKWHSE